MKPMEMKILICTLCTVFVFIFSNRLSVPTSSSDKCSESRRTAIADLKKNKVVFMIQGGIVSTRVKGQERFEKKFKVHYLDLGCVVPAGLCIESYNQEVSKHLDRLYGKLWRKEVRTDIKGV
jgi:hypothetical protein